MSSPDDLPGRTYLRLSITDRCNFRCRYCRPESGAHESEASPSADDAELLDLVRLIHEETGVHKLRLSGGEPLVHSRVVGMTSQIRSFLPEAKLAITTNGTLLAQEAAPLRRAGLDAVNVSLDSLDPDRFRDVTCGGRLEATLRGIRVAAEAGFSSVKINTVLIRRINGDHLPELVRFAADLGCEIRFIELMPFGHGKDLFRTDYLAAEDAIESLAQAFEYISDAPATSTASRRRFLVDGRVATVGFITPVSHPFCSRCDRLRLTRTGHLYACLRKATGVDLITPLRSRDEGGVRDLIRSSLRRKTPPGQSWPCRQMVSIGG